MSTSTLSPIALLLALWLCTAFAKTVHAQPDLPGSQVRVEKLFDARLTDANRIEQRPTLPTLDTSVVTQRYEVIPVDVNVDYEPPKIRPLAVRTEEPGEVYKGFARAGIGYAPAWLGDLGYAAITDQFAYRLDAHTYGFRGNYNDDQQYTEAKIDAGLSYYTASKVAIDFGLGYDYRGYRYYGFQEAVADTSLRISDSDVKQNFGVFSIRAGVRNLEPTRLGIDYFVRANVGLLNDNFDTQEANSLIEFGGRKDLSDIWYAEAQLDVDLTTLNSTDKQSLNNYHFKPTFGAHFEQFGMRIGADIASANDTFRIFPALELSYSIGGGFVAIVGADGGLQKNNYNTLSSYLPYVVTNPLIRNAETYRLYGSLQGQTRGVNYKATLSYSRVNNLAVFFQDSARAYQFRPRYDTANIVGINLEASMPVGERASGALLIDNRIYALERFDKPYLLPSFDAELRLGYQVLPEQLNVQGIMVFQNSLPFATLADDGTLRDDDDATGVLLDFSVHGDYRINKQISAFAQLNNLFDNHRRKFPFYPMLGTNVMVGGSVRF